MAAVRGAFAAGCLGFADVVLIELPNRHELRRRRDGDRTRRRRSFNLHFTLGAPLAEWYRAVDSLDRIRRVFWQLPSAGVPTVLPSPRRNRSDPHLLEALVERLPPVSG